MANELAVINYNLETLVDGVNVMNEFKRELGEDARPEFATAKTPSSGMTAWSIMAFKDDPDPEITKTIDGAILHAHKTNAYWAEPMDAASGVLPDCSSADGKTGIARADNSAHDCASCPLNRFGSDGGRGKACKNSRVIYILRDGDIMPIKVMLAPTGNKPYEKYIESLMIPKKRGQRPQKVTSVVTRIGLKVETSQGGQKYSLPTFECIGVIPEEARGALEDYGRALIEAQKAAAFVETTEATPFDE